MTRSVLPVPSRSHPGGGGILAGASIGALYYASSEIGLRWFLAGSRIAEVWPASGVFLAGLLLIRRGWWPHAAAGVWIANFASELVHRSSVAESAGLATANVGEGLLAAALLVWLVDESELVDTTRGVLLLGAASALGPALSATIGAATIVLSSGGAYGAVWARWWIADSIGMLGVTAFAISWAQLEPERALRRFRTPEGYAYLAAVAGVLAAVFAFHHSYAETVVGGYLLVPLLLWAAFRFGPAMVAAIGLATTTLVVLRSTHDTMFFTGAGISTTTGVLGIQVVLGALLLSSLVVAGLVKQRDLAEERARTGDAERGRLEAIMNASDDAIVGVDLTGTVYAWSPGAERMFGWPAAEMLGAPMTRIAFPADHEAMLDLIARVGAGEVIATEARSTRRDGSPVEVAVSMSPVRDSSGEVRGIAWTLRDIGWRKQAETKILAAQKLESLGLLAGNVAHDFNNLLVGIVGNVSLALDQLVPGDPARELLLEVQRAAERATALTRQLLAVSGRGRFLAEPVALAAIAQEAAARIRPSLPAAVTLRIEHAGDTPAVEGDAGQLLQVVSNLALNAVEALPASGGAVSIRTGTVDADAALLASFYLADGLAEGRYVSLEVADDGAGMDEATIGRIFDPFYSTKGEGRGLGLAALLGIVRSHRGAVSIDSTPGAGTTFTLLFPPSERPVEREAEPESAPESSGAGGLVLVADDDPQVRTLATRMLRHLGWETIDARDGEEAVALFAERRQEIRLVLLDLMMPGLHGTEVLARIHAQAPRTPVLLSSGYNTEDLVGKVSAEQVAGFVQKPYVLDTLRAAIEVALQRAAEPG